MAVVIITSVAIVVVSVPLILLWWKVADQWADAEHRRYRGDSEPEGPPPKVVRGFETEPLEDRTAP